MGFRFFQVQRNGDLLGQGSFGQVFEATITSTGEVAAIKIQHGAIAAEEISTWSEVSACPNVVTLIETFCEPTVSYIVMEKCQCNLAEYLWSGVRADCPSIFTQCLTALVYIHGLASYLARNALPREERSVSRGQLCSGRTIDFIDLLLLKI